MSAFYDATWRADNERTDSAIDAAADLEQRRYERREELYAAALKGHGDFWPGDGARGYPTAPEWDREQHLRIALAVRNAIRDPGLTSRERWEHVLGVVDGEAMLYAIACAEQEIPR